MAASPNNPGIIILLVIAGLVLVPAFMGAMDFVVQGRPGPLVGLAFGLVLAGVAHAALCAPAELRFLAWFSFGLGWVSIMGFLAVAIESASAPGFVLLGHVAGWLTLPFANAVRNQGGPPSPE